MQQLSILLAGDFNGTLQKASYETIKATVGKCRGKGVTHE